MAISTVLFDYSGVLTSSLDLPVVGVPYDPALIREEMQRALSPYEPNAWHEVERGERSLESYLDYLDGRAPGSRVLFEPDSAMNRMATLEVRDDRLRLVADLKAADYRVGLVTNNIAEWQPLWRPKLPGGLFEVVVDSSDVGHRKPEPEIYRLAMEMLGIEDADEVLFIDDFTFNVRGAEDAGMVGLHCEAETDLRVALAAHVGSLSRRSRIPAGRRRRRH